MLTIIEIHFKVSIVITICLLLACFNQAYSTNNGENTSLSNFERTEIQSTKEWISDQGWNNWLYTQCNYFSLSDIEIVNHGNVLIADQKSFWRLEQIKEMDLKPFIESLGSENKSIGIFSFKNTRIILFNFVMMILMSILILLMIFHLSCVNPKKTVEIKKCCYVLCLVILFLFLTISALTFGYSLMKGKDVQDSEEKLLCEALRIPKTFLDGNLENQIELINNNHFLGLRNIRNWVQNFLTNYDDFFEGNNHNFLMKIRDTELPLEIQRFYDLEISFKKNFESSRVPDETGNDRIPNSIVSGLRIFHEYMEQMIQKYKDHGNRIQGLGDMFELIKDNQSRTNFKNDLEKAVSEISSIEKELLTFWGHMINSVFSEPGMLKKEILNSVILNLVVLIILLGIFFGYVCLKPQKKLRYKRLFRGLVILACIFVISTLVMGMLSSKSIYSTEYGCGVLYKLIDGDQKIMIELESQLGSMPRVRMISDVCFFSLNKNTSESKRNLTSNIFINSLILKLGTSALTRTVSTLFFLNKAVNSL